MQFRLQVAGVVRELLADRQDADLFGRQPERELASIMLDQNAEETLQRTEQRTVDHVGAVLLAIRADIRHVEAFGQVEVELDGTGLPFTAKSVLDLQVDLRAVEGAAAFIHFAIDAFRLDGVLKGVHGLRPHVVVADGFRGARRQISLHILESEALPHIHAEAEDFADFVFDLFRRADDVGIVLREAADAHQAVQHAGLLIAVNRAKLGPAGGQFTVGARTRLVDHDMERAVHRLDIVGIAVDFHVGVHAFAIEIQMSGRLPQQGAADMRRVHQFIAMFVMGLFPERLQDVADAGAHRMPADQTGADFLMGAEQFHFSADLAVVAFLGFFNARQIFLQGLLALERRAVDALQHRILLVAAEIGARQRQQLDSTDLASMLHMGATAQIDVVVARVVQADRLAFRNVFQAGELERLAFGFEQSFRLFTAHFLAGEREPLAEHLLHHLFDFLQIFRNETLRQIDVVVEAVFRARADIELRLRIKLLYRGRHDMRRAMAHRAQINFRHDIKTPFNMFAFPLKRHTLYIIYVSYSRTPFVDGMSEPPVRVTATRKARPNDLKIDSSPWWDSSQARRSTCSVMPAVFTNA